MEIEEASKESLRNRERLSHATNAGCYQCMRTFPVGDITEWTDDGETAICPHCDIDSVLADVTDVGLLTKMFERWFCGVAVSASAFREE